jgi:Uri superfamily endonuclease
MGLIKYLRPMAAINLQNIPTGPGSYALLLNLDRPQHLQIGRLTLAQLQPGLYIYLGSAWGPGGLRARVNRHLCGQGALRWHIDYLRRVARVIGVYTHVGDEGRPTIRLECLWSQALATQKDAFWPAPGFGASDCQAGCPAHLVGFTATPALLAELLARTAGGRAECLQYWNIESGAACAQSGVR